MISDCLVNFVKLFALKFYKPRYNLAVLKYDDEGVYSGERSGINFQNS